MGTDGLPLVGIAVGVRCFHPDFRHRHREHFRRNLGHDGQESLTNFHAGHAQVQRAILVEFEKRSRGRVRRHGRRFPEASHGFANGHIALLAAYRLAPLDFLGHAVNGTVQIAGVHVRAVGQRVAFANGVELAEGHRVHADGFGHAGHVRLEAKVEFGIAETAIGPTRRHVGVHTDRVNLDVGHAVRPRGGQANGIHHVGAVFRRRARIPVQGVLQRSDSTILFHTQLDAGNHALPLRGVHELLFARPVQLHWAALHHNGQHRGDDFHGDARLAAKAAAYIRRHNANILVRQAERLQGNGHDVALRKRRLR